MEELKTFLFNTLFFFFPFWAATIDFKRLSSNDFLISFSISS